MIKFLKRVFQQYKFEKGLQTTHSWMNKHPEYYLSVKKAKTLAKILQNHNKSWTIKNLDWAYTYCNKGGLIDQD